MLSHDNLMRAETLDTVELEGSKITGKVRDIYHTSDGHRILITTDRVSAFDRVLGLIPYKGQVLNQLSLWWFNQTQDIVPNHVVAAPDPNVTIAREAETLPVEVVVRGYITGVTSTSMWTLYEQGERQPYGISLPEGLHKNDPLPGPVITPTTKAQDGGHDQRITSDEIVARGLVAVDVWMQVQQVALALFQHGQQVAKDAGLTLVDTKYEFGLIDGQLTLIDEIHTPDSSRYWLAGTHTHLDKEHLRQWFAAQGYRGEGQPPQMPPEFIAEFAALYIDLYQRLTGEPFIPGQQPAAARIATNLKNYQHQGEK